MALGPTCIFVQNIGVKMQTTKPAIRVGHFQRNEDVHDVSGTGRVAEWVEFSDGIVVVRWLSNQASTNVYNNIKNISSIHGHDGRTKVVVDWEADPSPLMTMNTEDEEETDQDE